MIRGLKCRGIARLCLTRLIAIGVATWQIGRAPLETTPSKHQQLTKFARFFFILKNKFWAMKESHGVSDFLHLDDLST